MGNMSISMRRALVILFLVVFGSGAWTQTPPQFRGLLTTSTDYTCTGRVPCATWPMPPIPAPGESYVDSTWRTATYRLAVPHANANGQAVTTYSRVQAWNSSNSKMFLTELVTPQSFLD